MAQAIGKAVTPWLGWALQTGTRNLFLPSRPYVAKAVNTFVVGAEASREFVRRVAESGEHPLTEEEYLNLYGEDPMSEPRVVRVCYQKIRAKRGKLQATDLGIPSSMFAHWILEVC
jgi:hypothetical protein